MTKKTADFLEDLAGYIVFGTPILVGSVSFINYLLTH